MMFGACTAHTPPAIYSRISRTYACIIAERSTTRSKWIVYILRATCTAHTRTLSGRLDKVQRAMEQKDPFYAFYYVNGIFYTPRYGRFSSDDAVKRTKTT